MRPIALLIPFALMACTMTDLPAPPTPADPAPDACGANRLQWLVGGPVSAFDPATATGAVRVIRPGMAVTMDFSETRLNLETDAAGMVTRVRCG
jgi:hypothetical protein